MKNRLSQLQSQTWLKILAIFLVWRILISGLFFISIARIHQIANPQFNAPINTVFPLQGTIKWDGLHYLRIVVSGYGKAKSGLPAFYPLFPFLVRSVTRLGIGPVPAAALINFVASFFACYFLYLLARDYFKDGKNSIRALLLFMFFPTAYFLFAFYTEALFCTLTFGAFYFARQRRWLACNLLLAPLTALRLPGLIVAAAVFLEYLSSKQWRVKQIDLKLLWFLLAPAGFVAYVIYLWRHFHDPLMFAHAYKYGWGYQIFNPNIPLTLLQGLTNIFNSLVARLGEWQEAAVNQAVEVGSWLFGLAIAIIGIRKFPASYSFFMLASLVLFSLNSNFVSANRYILPLFPIYLLLADWFDKREAAFGLFLAGSATAMGLYLTLFSNGYWTG